MPLSPPSPRRLILHVGTHKTGTKALQVYLASNRRQLAEAGVHYPLAGRHELKTHFNTPGHHQVAFDLAHPHGGGSLAAVAAEIRLMQAATVVLSSEEFLPLLPVSGALQKIVELAHDLGYEPIAVIVLRAQPDYVESIYSELAKASASSNLDDLLEQAIRDGRFTPLDSARTFELTYSSVIERLETIFGPGKVIARAYRPDRGLDFGHTDFLSVVGQLRGGLRLRHPRNPMPSVNERVTLLQLFTNIAATRGLRNFDARTFVCNNFPQFDKAGFAQPFSLITRADRVRFLARFSADNAAVNARFDTTIPFVSASDITMSDADEMRAQEHRLLLAAVLEATASVRRCRTRPRQRQPRISHAKSRRRSRK